MQKTKFTADLLNGSMNNNWLSNTPVFRSETRRRLAAANLKRCPLCGSVNAKSNHECFVCRWHGGFDVDPARIEESLLQLMDQCPEFIPDESLLEAEMPRFSVKAFLKGLFRRRRVDYRI